MREGCRHLFMIQQLSLNRNDCSLVTLFHIMIVNNWYVTTNMLCDIVDNNWPRLYFGSFWILVVLIMLNKVLSILIEVYGSAQQKAEEGFKKQDLTLKLMKRYGDNS